MATEVLGAAVHHDIGAKIQRTLADGRGERVVASHQRAPVMCEVDRMGEIGDAQQWVGRRLKPQQACRTRQRGLYGRWLSGVYQLHSDPAARDDRAQLVQCPVVPLARRNDVIATAQLFEHRETGGKARGKRERSLAAL